jgi:hypothetical protein
VVKLWSPRALLHHKPAARHWASRLAALAEIRTLGHFVVAGRERHPLCRARN